MYGIDKKIACLADAAEEICRPAFREIDEISEYNGAKVLRAFSENKVTESCFYGSTGYGYGDTGREILDKVYADVFGAQDALVRFNFISGTHALSTALFGILRPGDTLLSLTGKPYDTLEEVIGLSGKSGDGSLRDFGINYSQIDLNDDGSAKPDEITKAVKGAKCAYIQRSRGYSLRPALTVGDIEEIIKAARKGNPDIIVMVDNCYGEFVESCEPLNVGADLIVGSLIKNPGGGIARTGGYIAGKADLVELCSYRLSCVGMGKEVGCTLGMNRELFMGLFHAPDVTANALKTATFASEFFTLLGFECSPRATEKRGDIITAVKLGDEKHLTAFCRGIQKGSPVDSFAVPEPWDMPGYDSKVIMAAGAFTLGASIELSADAPIREPYAAWMQGGITYTSGKLGVIMAAQEMFDEGLL